MIKEFTLGEWLPEQSDYGNPGLEVCKNVIPSPSGYNPAYALETTAATVSGTVLGAIGLERSDGTSVVCAGTTSDLYVIVGGTANASSLSLSLSNGDWISFAQFDAKVYASTKNGDTWVLDDIETDTTFAAASGTPPEANALGRVGEFLVAGNLQDIGAEGDQPYRVRWSQFNNPDGTWGTDVATQSDFQDLDAQQGPVTAISGGTFGLIFQKFGISRMDYIGGSSVFRFELYEKNRGAASGHSVVRVGDQAYFLSFDGFFVTDGASTQSISRGRVWEWFLENANQSYIQDVVGTVDWQNRCVVWAFAGDSARAFTDQLRFNWETGRWSHIEQAVDFPVTAAKDGLSLEQVAAIYSNLDTMTISLDSPVFQPAGRTIKAFSGGALSTFTGASLMATFESGSMQPQKGRRSFVRGVTPLIANESENTICTIGYRDTMTKSYTVSPASAVGTIGYAPFNVDGRYFRVGMEVPAATTWSDAYGYQVEFNASGAY